MQGPRGVSPRIVALVLTLAAGVGVAAAQTPSGLLVEGVVNNRHVITPTPQFCWTFTGTQTNWQIQVDDDPNFTLNQHQATPQVWFWDSGDQDKGTANDDRCATMRAINKTGFVAVSADRRTKSIYWRLRVRTSSGWGPWVASQFRMNQIPLMPDAVTALADPLPSLDPLLPTPAPVTGRTFYVSPSGNDANAGTQASPFRTLNFATKKLLKGDTLLVRGGVYNENVLVSANAGHASGEPNNPITVKAYPGETPVVRALSSGTRTALSLQGPSSQLTDWVVDGLTVGGSSTAIGVEMYGVKNFTLKNCRFESTVTTSAVGIFVWGGSEDSRITGCRIDQPLFDQIELSGGRNIEIRNNEFSAFNSRHGIHAHGGHGMNVLIADNWFHDGAPYESTIFLYLGMQGTRVVNNVFSNILLRDPGDPTSAAGIANALLIVRSGQITVDSNVFYNVENIAVQLNEMTAFSTVRNNIFVKCAAALRFRGGILGGSSTDGAVADYNMFYDNEDDLATVAGELVYFDHPPVGNCYGGPPPSSTGCDPRFVNASAGDFRVQAGSPAIDAGDPASYVPVGGGSRIDIGRYESGATSPPYDYQPRVNLQDATPVFTWEIHDVDNLLEILFDDLPPGDWDVQHEYQVQIDTRPTFDSLSEGRPLLDSGPVASPVEGFTVPVALPPGEYYMRVRQRDENEFRLGPFSDHHFRFRISGEPAPPYLASLVPAAGAVGVLETSPITLHVRDDGVGVDIASIRVWVNGAPVTPVITGTLGDYTVIWTPPAPFVQSSTVTVRVVAEDLDQSPPGLDSTYSFTIRDTTPPLPPTNVVIIP